MPCLRVGASSLVCWSSGRRWRCNGRSTEQRHPINVDDNCGSRPRLRRGGLGVQDRDDGGGHCNHGWLQGYARDTGRSLLIAMTMDNIAITLQFSAATERCAHAMRAWRIMYSAGITRGSPRAPTLGEGGGPEVQALKLPGDEGLLKLSSKLLRPQTQNLQVHAVGWSPSVVC